jgi:hypothetical protein
VHGKDRDTLVSDIQSLVRGFSHSPSAGFASLHSNQAIKENASSDSSSLDISLSSILDLKPQQVNSQPLNSFEMATLPNFFEQHEESTQLR